MSVKLICIYTPLVFILLLAPVTRGAAEVLETLVVSGKHTAMSALAQQVVIKTERDFTLGARLDPAELLQRMPGVQVDSRSNYAQDTRISVRGFGARSAFGVRGVDLLVDGIPLSSPDGQGQLSSVMLDNIARVEVVRGPLAGLYGNGAGGVIALQTAAPEENQLTGSLVVGDPGLQRQLLQGEWRDKQSAARIQVATAHIAGERPHSQAEREQMGLQFFYRTDSHIDVLIKHDASNDPLLQDPLGLTPVQWRSNPWQLNSAADSYNTRKAVEHQQTSLSVRAAGRETTWQLALWQGERAITQYLGFSGAALTSSGGVVDLTREFYGASGNVTRQLDIFPLPVEWSLGAEVAQMEDRRRGYVNEFGVAGAVRRNELGRVENRDIYSLVQLNPLGRFSLYAGARRAQVDVNVDDYFMAPASNAAPANPDDSGARFYREHAYAFGANYALAEQWYLFASRGRGYETPTLTEMAYRTDGSGLHTELATAIAGQQQWGLRYHADLQTEFSITRFFIATHNELVVDQSVNGRTSFRNATATQRDGMEFFGRYTANDFWRVQLSAQVLDARYSAGDISGQYLPGVAREQYQIGVEWRPFARDSLQLQLDAQQRSRVFSADNNQVFAPEFITVDLAVAGGYKVAQANLKWWMKLINVADENYVGSVIVNQSSGRAFEPALGRQLLAGIALSHSF